MELPKTRALLERVEWLETADSTNARMRELVAREHLPHGAVVATDCQTAGRGRQGRGWETPPHTALAASMLVRGFAQDPGALSMGWLPLLAGSAVSAALRPLFARGEAGSGGSGEGGSGEALRVGVKWPNDVHVRDERDAELDRPGLKLCGILCEALPGGEVIVGFGINLLIPDWQLPTERATSVLARGGDVGGGGIGDASGELGEAETLDDPAGQALTDRVLSAAATELLRLVALAAADPAAARARVLRDSVTIGAEVRVHLPGGEAVDGRAVGLADDGSLIVDRPTSGQLVVSAADVEHLR